jgi:hypothetical protein
MPREPRASKPPKPPKPATRRKQPRLRDQLVERGGGNIQREELAGAEVDLGDGKKRRIAE